MRREFLDWNFLLPIENPKAVGLESIPEIRKKSRILEKLNPVLVIPFGSYGIVWDGFDRTLAHMISGKQYINSEVVENDYDLSSRPRWEGEKPIGLYEAKIQFIEEIYPALLRGGIRSFKDYEIFKVMTRGGLC